MNKLPILYGLLAGMIIADIVPTPADALVFYKQRINKQKLETGEITPKQYWERDAANYYLLNPIWWALVAGVAVSVGSDFKQKRNILIGLASAGAVVAVIYKNIAKDEQFYAKAINNHLQSKDAKQ